MIDTRGTARSISYGAVGIIVVMAAWQLASATETLGGTVTSPAVVAGVFTSAAQRSVIGPATIATASEAVQGFWWALLAAIIVGVLVTVVRPLRRGVDQLATIESAIPFVALAPVMIALFSRQHVPAAIAAATAFFPLYIGVINGLDALPPSITDLLTVLGSTRRASLLLARLPAGLPIIATGMKVGMPLAIVGAVIGEWFGASAGLGPVMLAAMRSYRMPTMWAAVVATLCMALILYGLCAVIERFAVVRFG